MSSIKKIICLIGFSCPTKNLDIVNSFYSLDLKQPMTKDDALEYIMDNIPLLVGVVLSFVIEEILVARVKVKK